MTQGDRKGQRPYKDPCRSRPGAVIIVEALTLAVALPHSAACLAQTSDAHPTVSYSLATGISLLYILQQRKVAITCAGFASNTILL